MATTNAPKLRLDIAEKILEERSQFDRIREKNSEGHTETKGWAVKYLLSGKSSNNIATRVNPNPARPQYYFRLLSLERFHCSKHAAPPPN
jgi:hypothetical protein